MRITETYITNQQVSLSEREATARQWIAGMESLRGRLKGTSNDYFEDNLQYLHCRVGFAEPITFPGGYWGLKRQFVTNYAFDGIERDPVLVPLFASDAGLNSHFAVLLQLNLGAMYTDVLQAIYLPPESISPTWRGIALLQMLERAWRWRGMTLEQIKERRWRIEYVMNRDDFKLIRQLYGKPYSDLVYRLSKQYERLWRSGDSMEGKEVLVPNDKLERVFGKAESETERGTQRTRVLMNAMYRALDRMYPKGDKRAHYDVTRQCYELSGTPTTLALS